MLDEPSDLETAEEELAPEPVEGKVEEPALDNAIQVPIENRLGACIIKLFYGRNYNCCRTIISWRFLHCHSLPH